MSEMSSRPHLARKWVIPNSGRDCHAWMKRIFASIRLIWATFWWASRIRAEICQRQRCHVSTDAEMTAGTRVRLVLLQTKTPPSTADTAAHQSITKTQPKSIFPQGFLLNLSRTFKLFCQQPRQTDITSPLPSVEVKAATKLLFYNHPSR